MDISLICNISISKKLRGIFGESVGRIVMVVDPIENGLGQGSILISGDNLDVNAIKQSMDKETSIQFTPIDYTQSVPSGDAVSNIFSTNDISQNGLRGSRTAVDKLAVTHAPEKHEVHNAIKQPEEIETPEAFTVYKDPSFVNFVSNMEELTMAVKAAQGKESEINVDSIVGERQKAVARELKEQSEAIDIPAYVVNDSCSTVTINDIGLSLNLNMPVDLSHLSAKRLAKSEDLRAMLRSNVIKFIRPDEVNDYRAKIIDEAGKFGLETYSTHDEAVAAFDGVIEYQNVELDIPIDSDAPNEQEQLAGLINLTPMSDSQSGGVRTSFHGSNANRIAKSIGNASSVNSKGIKTVSRL